MFSDGKHVVFRWNLADSIEQPSSRWRDIGLNSVHKHAKNELEHVQYPALFTSRFANIPILYFVS